MRAAGSDENERLIPPKILNLEQALEYCREDECVEVTPINVRIRKVILDQNERSRMTSKAKKANQENQFATRAKTLINQGKFAKKLALSVVAAVMRLLERSWL